ncbi:hypothetical protein [Dysgonomonas reticulitermitis]
MEGIDNIIAAQTGIEELLHQMEQVAAALVTGPFITDFRVHDTNFIRRTKACIPFIWLVRENGTHLFWFDDASEAKKFMETLDYYENHSGRDFCLYRYNGCKLFPVFPKAMRLLVEREIKNISSKI